MYKPDNLFQACTILAVVSALPWNAGADNIGVLDLAALRHGDHLTWNNCRTRLEHLADSDTYFRMLQIQAFKGEHKLRPFSQEDIERDLRNAIVDLDRIFRPPVVLTQLLGFISNFAWRKSEREDRIGKDGVIARSTFV